jgi:hypothetical protein
VNLGTEQQNDVPTATWETRTFFWESLKQLQSITSMCWYVCCVVMWGTGVAGSVRYDFNCRRTLVLAQELGDRAVEAQSCYSLGNTYTLLRDYPMAVEYHLRHLIIAQQLRDRVGEGMLKLNVAGDGNSAEQTSSYCYSVFCPVEYRRFWKACCPLQYLAWIFTLLRIFILLLVCTEFLFCCSSI